MCSELAAGKSQKLKPPPSNSNSCIKSLKKLYKKKEKKEKKKKKQRKKKKGRGLLKTKDEGKGKILT